MRDIKSRFSIVIVWGLLASVFACATEKKMGYEMFPVPDAGFTRYIVEVPKVKDPQDKRVELLIGREMEVDCNRYSFRADVKEENLKGWGYHYYRIEHIQPGPTTMMACRAPKVHKFITVNLPKELRWMRYNSRLGIVVYVPEGYEVRYRIWEANERLHHALRR